MVMMRNPDLERLDAELRSSNSELSNLMVTGKMTDRHPKVIQLKIRIASIQKQINDTPLETMEKRTHESQKLETIRGQW